MIRIFSVIFGMILLLFNSPYAEKYFKSHLFF